MAGGTGGHVFPALAIAEAFRSSGSEVLWLGTRGRMEEQLVPKYGFPIAYIDVRGVRRNGLLAKLKAPFMVTRAVCQSLLVLRKFRPEVVLGMGGYASGPGGIAAKLLRIPVIIHEQNAAAGLTNRLLFKLARKVMLGFPGAFSGPKVSVVGNPVRPQIVALHSLRRDFRREALHVLIVGGSLGAQALNQIVPEALKQCRGPLVVTHQCGRGNEQSVRALYENAPFAYQVSDFIDDMTAAYTEADLIICRAGAMTVAEVSCANLPAVFVPLPSAVDDHQTKNATFLKEAGAAQIISQSVLSSQSLSALVDELNADRGRLESMSSSMHDCAITDAAQRAVAIIEDLKEEK